MFCRDALGHQERLKDRTTRVLLDANGSHADQIKRAKMAIDLLYQLYNKAKVLIVAAEDSAAG
jgi:hypothetical protein